MYLAVILDLYSRKVIGWATSHRINTELVLSSLKNTTHRVPANGVILHTDQGSQFTSYVYISFLKANNIIPSMSRRGNCYDNAVAESFFKTFKREIVRQNIFATRSEAHDKIFEYIEMFYNSKRRHIYLNYISPNEFENRYNKNIIQS